MERIVWRMRLAFKKMFSTTLGFTLIAVVLIPLYSSQAWAKNVVQGIIVFSDGKPAAGVRVVAMDSDPGGNVNKDDTMGEANTDAQGYYKITYKKKDWDQDVHIGKTARPDIYIKVLRNVNGQWVQVDKSDVHSNWDMSKDLTINRTIQASAVAPPPAQPTSPVAQSPVDPLCGSSEILSCSVYALGKGIRDPPRKFYSDKFHAACAYHDWCYRYGYATYGRSKKDCDEMFLKHMLQICGQIDWRTLLSPGISPNDCQIAATTFYTVVRNAKQAAAAYQKGTTICQYDGFCPPGKFETTGFLHGCTCPPGHNKVHTGIAQETAYCSGTVACPPGRFSTTGQYRGCYCPEGSNKKYESLTGNAYAQCEGIHIACPGGEFGTTGTLHDCNCPDGSHKVYLDPLKAKARCTTTCPSGEFKTTGSHKGCECPPGTKKHYVDVLKYKARCK